MFCTPHTNRDLFLDSLTTYIPIRLSYRLSRQSLRRQLKPSMLWTPHFYKLDPTQLNVGLPLLPWSRQLGANAAGQETSQ